ncbi:MAG: hypothetical protein HYZ74_08615 [Elusimicrobia bacterium]|nr:hypothetical protein [Elusimicrobiota bacterium]
MLLKRLRFWVVIGLFSLAVLYVGGNAARVVALAHDPSVRVSDPLLGVLEVGRLRWVVAAYFLVCGGVFPYVLGRRRRRRVMESLARSLLKTYALPLALAVVPLFIPPLSTGIATAGIPATEIMIDLRPTGRWCLLLLGLSAVSHAIGWRLAERRCAPRTP